MAEPKRMTADELVSHLLEGEGLDFLRESLAWICQQLMEAEVSDMIGAEFGERTPERLTQRNGYRLRPWHTRAGELELQIPKLRRGSYFPSFLEPRRRSEEAYVAGVCDAQGRPGGGVARPSYLKERGVAHLPGPGRAGRRFP
jgi:putative transposase